MGGADIRVLYQIIMNVKRGESSVLSCECALRVMIIALMIVTPSQFMIAGNSSSLHSRLLEELLHKAKVTIDHDITQAHFPRQRSSIQ